VRTPRSKGLPEKLTGPQPVENFSHSMKSEGSLPHSQEPANCPCPEPDRSSGCTEGSVRFPGFCVWIVSWFTFQGEELCAPRPKPKVEDQLFSALRDCLFNIFAATLHICRPFLHFQPEDAPCRGDRDLLNTMFQWVSRIIANKQCFSALEFFIHCVLIMLGDQMKC
jgi:hypothetical protein